MKKIKQLVILLMAILIMPLMAVAAMPAIPLLVYGDVVIDGSYAPIGTIITVENNGAEIINFAISDEGTYFIEVAAENVGDVLTYKVDSITAVQKECADPANVPSDNIDLLITTEDTTPDTTTTTGGNTSGGGGGGGGGDSTPPTNTSITINSNNETTATAEVVLTLSASGASQMMIADNSDFAGAVWENYAVEKNWVLTGENGKKTVYAKFKDTAGNISNPVQDLIILSVGADQTAIPAIPKVIVLGAETDYRAVQLEKILNEAGYVWIGDAGVVSANMSINRKPEEEVNGYNKYTVSLIKGVDGLEQSNIYAITNFIVYGTPTTKILGAGERAGVLNSYKSAFGKLPTTESEWQDAIKIANGRWPNERSEAAETKAKQEFKKVYLREPDMDNPNDNAAVTVIAYGLRPDNRNLDSERAGILTFKHIYGHNPVSATDWDVVRAIAYSGAVR
ncbi:hypothetical protein L6267_01930 [Candidatus Parcubacteria bacterium]|nr:hypothetical protein [Candidatus Parcubacteria bacterium]